MTEMLEHLDIAVLKQEASRLSDVETGWATWDPEDRVAFRAEWHDLMDVFNHVVEAYDGGRLAPNDVDDLWAVSVALLNGLALMEQMRLRIPPHQVLDRIIAARVA